MKRQKSGAEGLFLEVDARQRLQARRFCAREGSWPRKKVKLERTLAGRERENSSSRSSTHLLRWGVRRDLKEKNKEEGERNRDIEDRY